MLMRKILSAMLMILGAGIYVFGSNMSDRAGQGEARLSQAEENVQDQRRPVLGPVRRNVRDQSTENAQQKIGAEGQVVAASQVTASWLEGTGIVLLILGMGCLIFWFTRKKSD